MDTLKKTLSGIAETISYLNMVAGYNRLRDRARQLRLEAEAYTRDITLILGKVELVQTLDALDGGRGRFLKEYLNIVAAFEHFAGVFEPQKSQPVEARVRTACDLIPGMINHLRPLRG
ncbi:alpha-xenorhabdolysin family binary toxin subunit B [Pseudomonas corrugata]